MSARDRLIAGLKMTRVVGRLFYDDEFEAIRAAIEGGQGYKKTANHLWPSMKPDSAYARLKACVNPDGDQRLKFGEIIAVMSFNDRYDPLYYACDECHHDRPSLRAPEDKQAELMRKYMSAVEEAKRVANQMERFVTSQTLKAVR